MAPWVKALATKTHDLIPFSYLASKKDRNKSIKLSSDLNRFKCGMQVTLYQ